LDGANHDKAVAETDIPKHRATTLINMIEGAINVLIFCYQSPK